MISRDELHRAERRAAGRSLAAVLALLLGVAVLGTWTTDTAGPDPVEVAGFGYGLHVVDADGLDGAGGALLTVLYSLPVLLVAATAVAAALVAGDPGPRRCRALAGLGAASTAGLLLVALAVGTSADLVGLATPLLLGLAGSAAAGALGPRATAARLDR